MCLTTINDRIPHYKNALASGELQQIYQHLVGIVQRLRIEFHKRYQAEYSVGQVLHGYLDVTYFYVQNDYLKKHKLKLAIVLNHQRARFELWLLGQTKDVHIAYWNKLKALSWVNAAEMPEWAIFEIIMLASPDFDNTEALTVAMHREFLSLSEEVFRILKAYA